MSRSSLTAARVLALLLLVMTASCWRHRRGEAEEQRITLFVRNWSTFDVTIYAIPSRGAPESRVRIGTVTALATDTLEVRDVLAPTGLLTLQLHAFATRSTWTSPGVQIGPGTAACLDVHADAYGNLDRSTLSLRLIAAGAAGA